MKNKLFKVLAIFLSFVLIFSLSGFFVYSNTNIENKIILGAKTIRTTCLSLQPKSMECFQAIPQGNIIIANKPVTKNNYISVSYYVYIVNGNISTWKQYDGWVSLYAVIPIYK